MILRATHRSSAPSNHPPLFRAHILLNMHVLGLEFRLVARDRVTGLLSLTNSVPNYYTQQHVRLAMTITNQVAVAIENAQLYEQAQNLAVVEERHRIARELHDSVTQLLYGITLYCTATSHTIRSGNLFSGRSKTDRD